MDVSTTNGNGHRAEEWEWLEATDEQPIARLKTVRIGDVIDTGPPKFLVEGLWLDKGAGIVGGDPKSWKSFFTVFMAVHIALGKKLMGRFECKQGKVVIFNAEDTASLTRFRIGCICRALDVDIRDLDLHLIDTPALFVDVPEHIELLRNTVKEEKPALLILDPLRNLHTLDENDSTILPMVLQPLRGIQKEFECAVQVIHHLVKASEGRTMASRLRGTGALRGWYDSGLVLDRQEDGGPVKVTVEHRGAEAPMPFSFEMQKSSTMHGDGEAIWFEECDTKKRPLQNGPSPEEQILDFKDRNPSMAGRTAMAFLRDTGLKFTNGEFWKVWNES